MQWLERRSARLVGLGGIALLVAAGPQLATRISRGAHDAGLFDSLKPDAVRAFLTKPAKPGEWVSTGQLMTVQNTLYLVVGIVSLLLVAGMLRRWTTAAVVVVAMASVAGSLVASIPTKAPEFATVMPKILIQAHIVGGSLWVGGLVALAVLALGSARRIRGGSAGSPGESQLLAQAWEGVWRRFGVLALVAVGGVLISGLWLTYREVGALDQFVTTSFGRFLFVKIVLVLGLITAGAFNQLSLMPRIARAQRGGDSVGVVALTLRHFPRVVWTEVLLGIGVLAIVPFLDTSARSQAAGKEVDGPQFDGGLFTLGLLLLLTMAAVFYGTARASEALGRRAGAGEGVGSTV